MSILTGKEIVKQVEAGKIILRPFDESCIGPNSVDVRLSDELAFYDMFHPVDSGFLSREHIVDMDVYNTLEDLEGRRQHRERLKDVLIDSKSPPPPLKRVKIPEDGYILKPGYPYLGATVEVVGSDTFVPVLHGRSSWGRIFLSPHYTAGFGDTGFKRRWTLEIVALYPTLIYPNMRIAQVSFETTVGEITSYEERAASKYATQDDPTASMLYREWHGA
jgi:dCTP deaminase